jgi:integrase
MALTQAEPAIDPRPKNFLTEAEVTNFLKAARKGRHGTRNFAMLLLAYRHGLRVSELINLRMAEIDLDSARLFVRRLKGSLSTNHPLEGDEIRALRAYSFHAHRALQSFRTLAHGRVKGPVTRWA